MANVRKLKLTLQIHVKMHLSTYMQKMSTCTRDKATYQIFLINYSGNIGAKCTVLYHKNPFLYTLHIILVQYVAVLLCVLWQITSCMLTQESLIYVVFQRNPIVYRKQCTSDCFWSWARLCSICAQAHLGTGKNHDWVFRFTTDSSCLTNSSEGSNARFASCLDIQFQISAMFSAGKSGINVEACSDSV